MTNRQRLQSATFLIVLVYTYHQLQFDWKLFALLILLPDVSFIGYLINTKIGAKMYNLGHNYAIPITILIAALIFESQLTLMIGTIWACHIAADRVLGFGLKSTGF